MRHVIARGGTERAALVAIVGAAVLLFMPYASSAYGVTSLALFALALVHHAAALLVGGALLGAVAPSLRGHGERWLFGWSLGLVVVGLAVFALGLARALSPLSVATVVVLLAAGAAALERSRLSSAAGEIAAAVDARALGVTAVVVGAVAALCALPPTYYDALSYHVALPQQFLLWGRDLTSLHHLNSGFPLVAELALAPLLFFSGDPRAMNVGQAGVLVMLVLAVSSTGKRLLGAGAGGFAALTVGAMPLAAYLATGTKPDLLHGVLALGALFLFCVDDEHGIALPARERAACFGLFLGGFIATKSSGLPLGGSLFVAVALVPAWRRRFGGKGLLLAGAAAAMVPAPLYLKNLLVLGNPLFPHLASLFETPPWAATTRAYLDAMIQRVDSAAELRSLWRLPWDLSFVVTDGTMNNLPGPLPLLGALLLVVARPLPRALLRMWAIVVVTLPAWLSLFSLLRYNAVLWIVAPLSAGLAFEALWRRGSVARAALACCLALGLAASASWTLAAQEVLLRRPSLLFAGGADVDTYLAEVYEPYPAYRFINATLPVDAVVLPVSDPRVAYLERRALPVDVYTQPLIEGLVDGAEGAGQILARARALGATHLLYEARALERYRQRGWLTSWSDAEERTFEAFLALLGEPLYRDERGFRLFTLAAAGGGG